MSETMNRWSVQVLGMIAIGAAAVAVFWIAEGFDEAWPVAVLMAAFIGLMHFGRGRFNTLEVMSGTGDERVRSLYMRAVAFAGAVMGWVLPGWWLVTEAQGDPSERLTILCALFGACFIGAVVVLARRN